MIISEYVICIPVFIKLYIQGGIKVPQAKRGPWWRQTECNRTMLHGFGKLEMLFAGHWFWNPEPTCKNLRPTCWERNTEVLEMFQESSCSCPSCLQYPSIGASFKSIWGMAPSSCHPQALGKPEANHAQHATS